MAEELSQPVGLTKLGSIEKFVIANIDNRNECCGQDSNSHDNNHFIVDQQLIYINDNVVRPAFVEAVNFNYASGKIASEFKFKK